MKMLIRSLIFLAFEQKKKLKDLTESGGKVYQKKVVNKNSNNVANLTNDSNNDNPKEAMISKPSTSVSTPRPSLMNSIPNQNNKHSKYNTPDTTMRKSLTSTTNVRNSLTPGNTNRRLIDKKGISI